MASRGSILYITLGCAKNEVDTDRMRALLTQAGHPTAESIEDAAAVIINTCSFLASATSESIETTLEIAEEVQGGIRELPLIMCGCVPSRYGDELPAELPEVAAFVRTDEEDAIVSVVEEVLGEAPREAEDEARHGGLLRTVDATSAYVKISDGCDRFCAFCAIPYIRGRYASRPYDEIAAEVEGLLEGGVKEIVLIGQDTGVWGSDFDEPETLAQLLRRLAPMVEAHDGWLRVLYLQPEGMTEELIDVLADVPAVLPYIDIPIQHSSAKVLKAMNRSGSASELKALFAHLRERIPGMVLRSTGLVGFPGETEEEFDDLVDFCREVGFDYLSVFPYSAEEGTRAATMADQVDEDEKLRRAQVLLDVAEELGFSATASHVGERVKVIVDGYEEDGEGRLEPVGHTWFQAPDSDGAIHLPPGSAEPGDVVTADIVDAFCYELEGEVVPDDAPAEAVDRG